MSFNKEFKDLINNIETNGDVTQPRDMKVKELTVQTLEFNPTEPFANFNKRKFNWKYFAGELAWYMRKDRDVDYIGQFSGMWSTLTNPDSNEINSNYGYLLFNDQLQWVLDSLKADKNTRQAIAFLNQPKFQFKGNKDFVCTMYLNFFIRDNKLNMKVQMRSNDIFYGLTFDAPFFAFVQQHMRLWLLETYPDLELGTYYHCADNIHFYERHFDLADNILNDTEDSNEYTMNIEKPLFLLRYNNMLLTEHGSNLLSEVDATIGKPNAKEQYNTILRDYLNIRLKD
jgi:thymidylate synthase